jgi:hypothetical protein
MAIKRHLLTEQRSIIDSEKRKCDATICSKVDEIEHIKENLTKIKQQHFMQSEINEKLSFSIYKYKEKLSIVRGKKGLFNLLKNYYMSKKNSNKVNLNVLI